MLGLMLVERCCDEWCGLPSGCPCTWQTQHKVYDLFWTALILCVHFGWEAVPEWLHRG